MNPVLATIVLACATWSVAAQPIERNRAEVRAFRAEHACPSTAKHKGPCPGFQVDHPEPLCAGGRDHRENMQWLSVEDHRWKTFVDVRECRKLRRMAATPARIPTQPE